MLLLLLLPVANVPSVYFHSRARGLVIRYPCTENSVAIYYSFDGAPWQGFWMTHKEEFHETCLPIPDHPVVLGLLFKVGDRIDDNQNDLYLYELRWRPRSILKIDLLTLERMFLTAQAKMREPDYQDEAYNILDYLKNILSRLPRYRGSYQKRVEVLKTRLTVDSLSNRGIIGSP